MFDIEHNCTSTISAPWHYSDITMTFMASQIPCTRLFSNRLLKLTSTKTSYPALLTICEWNPSVAGGSPHTGSVTRKTFPWNGVTMAAGLTVVFIYRLIHTCTLRIRYYKIWQLMLIENILSVHHKHRAFLDNGLMVIFIVSVLKEIVPVSIVTRMSSWQREKYN